MLAPAPDEKNIRHICLIYTVKIIFSRRNGSAKISSLCIQDSLCCSKDIDAKLNRRPARSFFITRTGAGGLILTPADSPLWHIETSNLQGRWGLQISRHCANC